MINKYYSNSTRKQLVKVIHEDESTLTYKIVQSDVYNPKNEFVNTKERFNNLYNHVKQVSQWK